MKVSGCWIHCDGGNVALFSSRNTPNLNDHLVQMFFFATHLPLLELSLFNEPESLSLSLSAFFKLLKSILFSPSGHDLPKLSSLLMDTLSECLPNLTPVHRHELTQYLTDTCITRRRLFQAVVGGAANMSITQIHLEVQLPPTPCPLAQVRKV